MLNTPKGHFDSELSVALSSILNIETTVIGGYLRDVEDLGDIHNLDNLPSYLLESCLNKLDLNVSVDYPSDTMLAPDYSFRLPTLVVTNSHFFACHNRTALILNKKSESFMFADISMARRKLRNAYRLIKFKSLAIQSPAVCLNNTYYHFVNNNQEARFVS